MYINNTYEASGMNSSIRISMYESVGVYKLTYRAETSIGTLPGLHICGN